MKHAPLFSNKALFKMIWPVVVGQILTFLVHTIDSVMVAYAGEAVMSGVSLVGTPDALLTTLFISIEAGGCILLSHALGRKNIAETKRLAKQMLYLTAMIAIGIIAVVFPFRKPLLALLFGDVEPVIMQSALDYFSCILFSFPFLALSTGILGVFRTAGNTVISLTSGLFSNLVNIIGNAVFIYGFGMGALGAALGTVIARFAQVIFLLIFYHDKKFELHAERLWQYRPDFGAIKQMLGMGLPMAAENGMFQFGRLLTQTLIAMLGSVAIAANAVALNLANYQYMVGNVFSGVIVTVIGRCIGAGETQEAKRYSRKLLLLSYVFMWIITAATILFVKPLTAMFNLSEASQTQAIWLLVSHSIVAAAIWPLGFVLPHVFKAAGAVKFTMVTSTVCMFAFRVALGYLLAPQGFSLFGLSIPALGWGITGAWIAMYIDWVVRISLYLFRYLSGGWLKKAIPSSTENTDKKSETEQSPALEN